MGGRRKRCHSQTCCPSPSRRRRPCPALPSPCAAGSTAFGGNISQRKPPWPQLPSMFLEPQNFSRGRNLGSAQLSPSTWPWPARDRWCPRGQTWGSSRVPNQTKISRAVVQPWALEKAQKLSSPPHSTCLNWGREQMAPGSQAGDQAVTLSGTKWRDGFGQKEPVMWLLRAAAGSVLAPGSPGVLAWK